MNSQADFDIWIVEDRLEEAKTFYLAPLERIALTTKGLFPDINLIVLGANAAQKKKIKDLRKEATRLYPETRPKVHIPAPEHEMDPIEFIDFLQHEMRDKDVALIDPTVCGLGWPASQDRADYLYYVFNKVRSFKTAKNEDRVLLVSNVDIAWGAAQVSKSVNAEVWSKMQQRTIGKVVDSDGAYDKLFAEKLRPFLEPPDEWKDLLNGTGKKEFGSFVRRIRGDSRCAAIWNCVGECALQSLLHLLSPKPHCATDLIQATNGHFYYEPMDDQRISYTPPLLTGKDARLYTILIRRFVLYGLRCSWVNFCPELTQNGYRKNNEDHYKLWLEVVAAGYYWYRDERNALRVLFRKLPSSILTLTSIAKSVGKIDLESDQIDFDGKGSRVKTMMFKAGDIGIRRNELRFIRFLDGDLFFRYKGEQYKGRAAENRAKFHYEVRFSGDSDDVPEDGASNEIWKEFWKGLSESNFSISRKGHVDKLQSRLSNRCYFAKLQYMLSYHAPMAEEVAWWQGIRQPVKEQIEHVDLSEVFDPECQSTIRINRTTPRD